MAVIGVVAVVGTVGGSSTKKDESELIVFAPVETRTLRDVVTVRGEISREKLSDLFVSTSGMVDRVSVEEGASVAPGEQVYSLNGRPGIAVNAPAPFFRPIDEGAVGLDVWQLENILVEQGYDPGEADLLFTTQSKRALGEWQHDHGFPNVVPEPVESINVSLAGNPSGYQVGPLSSAGAKIVPSARPLDAEDRDRLLAEGEGADEGGGGDEGGDATPTARTALGRAAVAPAALIGPPSPASLGYNAPALDRASAGATGREPVPTLNIISVPDTVGEGGTGSFVITATTTAPSDLSIGLAVSGTATAGSDYVYFPGAVQMEAGQSQISVPLSTLGDDLAELDETVTVTLLGGSGYLVGAPASATTTITSPDGPEIDVTVVEEEVREGQTGFFRFTASQPVIENTTVDLIVTGSAVEGDDYEEIEASVKFVTGAAMVDLPIYTLVDDVLEPDETINVQLQPLFGGDGAYSLGSETSAELTILADSELPVLSMEPTPKIVNEGQTSQFVITADRPSNDPIEITYTVWGSATPKDDYVELDGDVTLPPGATQTVVSIQTEPDRIVEADETVGVFLEPGEDYVTEAPTGGFITIESQDLPELSISGGGDVVEGGAAVFTVIADEPMSEATSINYSVNGTAMPGVDFESPTGVVVMPAGATTTSIVIPIIDDDSIFQPGDMVVAEWPARVGQVTVEEGQLVMEGEPIMEFVEDDFSINVTVNAVDRPELSEGLPTTVELAATGETVPGSLSRLDESASVKETTEVYEGEVAAEGDLTAIDGAQVNVDVILAESVDAIVVPVAAVLMDGQGNPQVRVVDPDDGTIRRISVVTGLTEGSYVEIIEGLTGDERVIVQIEDAVEDDSGVQLEGEGGSGGGSGGSGGGSSTTGGDDTEADETDADDTEGDGGGEADSGGEDTGDEGG